MKRFRFPNKSKSAVTGYRYTDNKVKKSTTGRRHRPAARAWFSVNLLSPKRDITLSNPDFESGFNGYPYLSL